MDRICRVSLIGMYFLLILLNRFKKIKIKNHFCIDKIYIDHILIDSFINNYRV